MLAKSWSIIHNIFKRAGRLINNHDTYIVDLDANSKGLSLADAIRDKSIDSSLQSRSLSTFSVGCYTGGELSITSADTGISFSNAIFRNVYSLASSSHSQLLPHTGTLFNVTSVCRFPDKQSSDIQNLIMEQSNSYAPNTLLRTDNGFIEYYDQSFALAHCHLSRSHYLGHLHSGKRKGFKIYDIERPLPTFTSFGNILIYDNRDPRRKGIRLLSIAEMYRINLFSESQEIFFRSVHAQQACKWIASCIPPGMLHTIYAHVYDDLQLEKEAVQLYYRSLAFKSSEPYLDPGGDSPFNSPTPNLSKQFEHMYSLGTSSFFGNVMGHLFGFAPSSTEDLQSPTFHNNQVDLDVSKKRHVNPQTSSSARDTTCRAAIKRMYDFHRAYHSPNSVAKMCTSVVLILG